MTDAQRKAIFGMCKNLGMNDDERRALIFGNKILLRVLNFVSRPLEGA